MITRELSLDEQYGKHFLSLLDPSKRESTYAELAKMEQSYPEAGIVVGQYYQGQEARKHFLFASRAGLAEGHWGVCSTIQHSYIPDPRNSYDAAWEEHCILAAEGGCADACSEMGNVCNRRNWYAESTYWYGLAAGYEHPQANVSLQGIAKKWVVAGKPEEYIGTDHFTEQRYESAMIMLNRLSGNPDDFDEHRLMKNAMDGDNMAGYLLAFIYEGSNDQMAYRTYNVMSFNDDAHAMKCQGDMLYTGKGVQQDIPGAFRMFQMAAERGDPQAMFIMGEMERTRGNRYLAACWYGKSFVRGFAGAQKRLTQMAYPG